MTSPRRAVVYHAFRALLTRSHELLLGLHELRRRLDLAGEDQPGVSDAVTHLVEGALRLATDTALVSGTDHPDVRDAIVALEREVTSRLEDRRRAARQRIVRALSEVGLQDAGEVGVKAARLGELRHVVSVPQGFVVTTAGYQLAGEAGDLPRVIHEEVAALRGEAMAHLGDHGRRVRAAIQTTPLPAELERAILKRAAQLRVIAGGGWAVRSSAVGVDQACSFAGQFDTALDVATAALGAAYRAVLASRFGERSLSYRLARGEPEPDSPLAVLFMPMIDAAKSGVVYSRDPHGEAAGTMWITARWGLGAEVTSGGGRADLYVVRRDPPGTLVSTRTVDKDSVLVARGLGIERRPVAAEHRSEACLVAADLKEIAASALAAERHLHEPQELEWAIDREGRLWVLQARPLVAGRPGPAPAGDEVGEPVLEGGRTVFPGRVIGPVCLLAGDAFPPRLSPGVVLVARSFPRAATTALPRLGGLILEDGRLDDETRATIRRLRVPAIVGVGGATALLPDGDPVGLDATERRVYAGVPWPELAPGVSPDPDPVPRAPGPVRDRVVDLHLGAGRVPGRRYLQRLSLRDLVEELRARGVAAMLEHDARERRLRGGVRRLSSSPPLDLHLFDLGDGLPGPETPTVAPADIMSVPFKALWLGVRVTGLGWPAGEAPTGHLVVARERACLDLRVGSHRLLVDAVVSSTPRRNHAVVQLRTVAGAGRHLAWFAREVLRRGGYHVDSGGDSVTAMVRGHAPGAMERALGVAGRLLGCLRAVQEVADDQEALEDRVERFVRGSFGGLGRADNDAAVALTERR